MVANEIQIANYLTWNKEIFLECLGGTKGFLKVEVGAEEIHSQMT